MQLEVVLRARHISIKRYAIEVLLCIIISLCVQYGLVKPDVQHLVVRRSGSSELSVLTNHLETSLQLR